jgi:tryptophan-rich sensory protein
MKYSVRLLLFFVVNFSALAIGAFLMGEGPTSTWYQTANQAPWTPPGWVFGAAWFTIMACFSLYMASLTKTPNKNITILFILLTLLNIGWNPLFFHFHFVGFSLVVITALTLLVTYTFIHYIKQLKSLSLLIFPYVIWLMIATSLNAYFLFNNP